MDYKKLIEHLVISGAGNPNNIFDDAATAITELLERAEKAEKERDYLLMEKLKAEGKCEECKYFHLLDECKSGVGCEFCDIPCYCHDCHGASKWEGRGVQED